MSLHDVAESRTLFDELPLAHIRVDVPVLDGDAVLGFSVTGSDVEGRLIYSTSWSRGAFGSVDELAVTLALEIAHALGRATATVD